MRSRGGVWGEKPPRRRLKTVVSLDVGENAPQTAFETVVTLRRRYARQVSRQGARRLVDGHLVVVEDDQYVALLVGARVVQALERQTARHGSVAYDGHHAALFAPQFGGLGESVRRRYGGRRVARAERVVFALGHARESADAALFAVGGEQVAPASDYLVRIGLMAHVPHEFVVRGVVNVMYGYGQLHRAEARRQVARVFRTLLDDVLTQLAAVARQLRDGEPLQIGGRIDLVEQVVIYMIHVVCVIIRFNVLSVVGGRPITPPNTVCPPPRRVGLSPPARPAAPSPAWGTACRGRASRP